MQIGFVGLGHMGLPMVKNLIAANFSVKVFDVNLAAQQAAVQFGAIAADSLKQITQNSDVVITMLQTGDQVKQVCLSEDGIFNFVEKDLIFIDCSSIEITITRELHMIAEQKNIAMLDAPVSGGVGGATAATLTFMVGGQLEIFQRAEKLFKILGKKIIHAGVAGCGQAAKICNNLILAISMIGVSEGFALAEKLGLDPKIFFEVSSNASGQCWSMTSYCPAPNILPNVPSSNDYAAGFTSKMMLKDLRLAQHAAESVNGIIPLGMEAAALYSLLVNQGFAEKDFSAIIKLF